MKDSGATMPRFKLTIEYDGSSFVGWQRQENGPSIQQALEAAIQALTGAPATVHGAGRTDAGVHAAGQVAHVDFLRAWEGWRLCDAVNAHLAGRAIAVLSAERVADAFDARRDAIYRRYRYRIVNRRPPLTLERGRAWRVKRALDAEAMHAAAQALVGRHDFTTFRDAECQANSPVRTIDGFEIARDRDGSAASRRALVSASPGALDGRIARRSGPNQVERRRSQSGARGGRSRALRAGCAGRRALSDGSPIPLSRGVAPEQGVNVIEQALAARRIAERREIGLGPVARIVLQQVLDHRRVALAAFVNRHFERSLQRPPRPRRLVRD